MNTSTSFMTQPGAQLPPASSHDAPRDGGVRAARFRGDLELLTAILDDPRIAAQLRRTEVLRKRSTMRARLLSHAVRVKVSLIPNVARSFQRLRERLDDCPTLEAYVFANPSIDAFVTQSGGRCLVAVSSGAVSMLSAEELEFVIGHELGHALYGHLDVPAGVVLELAPLEIAQQMQLRAWQRATEISADRAGLILCGSLEVAASALFKTMSGLELPGVAIDPDEFAHQWDGLVEEVLDHGLRGQWQLSHPFPPLRMQAMISFWRGRQTQANQDAVDAEVARLLAHMDPTANKGGGGDDPLLSRFSFWGGMYVALADGDLDAAALERFRPMAARETDLDALVRESPALPALCFQRFREARRTRREKLTSGDLHYIVTSLVDVAAHRGSVSDSAKRHLHRLATVLGVDPSAIQLFIDKQLKQG